MCASATFSAFGRALQSLQRNLQALFPEKPAGADLRLRAAVDGALRHRDRLRRRHEDLTALPHRRSPRTTRGSHLPPAIGVARRVHPELKLSIITMDYLGAGEGNRTLV